MYSTTTLGPRYKHHTVKFTPQQQRDIHIDIRLFNVLHNNTQTYYKDVNSPILRHFI